MVHLKKLGNLEWGALNIFSPQKKKKIDPRRNKRRCTKKLDAQIKSNCYVPVEKEKNTTHDDTYFE